MTVSITINQLYCTCLHCARRQTVTVSITIILYMSTLGEEADSDSKYYYYTCLHWERRQTVTVSITIILYMSTLVEEADSDS